MDAQTLIHDLNLLPHPEGGFYRETFKSGQIISINGHSTKSASTVIYFLLEKDEKSHFHRIQSDESWFFHQGEPLEIIAIVDHKVTTFHLGNDIKRGELPQAIIPANTWFAAKIKKAKGYALVSCVVAPGFEFADFQLARRDSLIEEFPDLKEVIIEFT